MKHRETRLCGPKRALGHFFCPVTAPLTRPSPQWGEGGGQPSAQEERLAA